MATADPKESREKKSDLVGDCRLMLRHVLKEGLDIPSDLQRNLTALDRELSRCGIPTLTDVLPSLLNSGSVAAAAPPGDASPQAVAKPQDGEPSEVRPPPGQLEDQAAKPIPAVVAADDPGAKPETSGQSPPDAMQLLYKVHGALLQVVAPATVASLLATEPMHGAEKSFASLCLGMPWIVRFAAGAAIVCALGFIGTAIPIAEKKSDDKSKAAKAGADTNNDAVKIVVPVPAPAGTNKPTEAGK